MAYDEGRCEVHLPPADELPEGHYSLMADRIDREWAALEAGADPADAADTVVQEPRPETAPTVETGI